MENLIKGLLLVKAAVLQKLSSHNVNYQPRPPKSQAVIRGKVIALAGIYPRLKHPYLKVSEKHSSSQHSH